MARPARLRHATGMAKARWVAVALALTLSQLAFDALACGGCFAPPQAASQVTGHRMVFAVSPERTVLWDKFEYVGAPEEFSWVLPIAPGAYLEEAKQAWFDALDAATDTVVTGPVLTCAQSGSSGGCGFGMAAANSSAAGDGASATDSPTTVRVVDQRTVGPYEVVTLSTERGDELFDWFDDNGYLVPDDIAPIIDSYVSEGSDFIAVKLRPGQGVQQMTPVRVVTPGGKGILPLRMVAAGVGEQVDIVLYVIGESRFEMPDLVEVHVAQDELVWDFDTNQSNYLRLRQTALSENAGFSYLTSYAIRSAFAFANLRPMLSSNQQLEFNIADLYQAEAAFDDGVASPCPGRLPTLLATNRTIVEDWEGQSLPASGALVCGGYSDLAAAMVGLNPMNTWLTRLELSLPKYALSMDCIVEPNESQDEVNGTLYATRSKNRPKGCAPSTFSSQLAAPPKDPALAVLGLLAAIAGAALLRRRQLS